MTQILVIIGLVLIYLGQNLFNRLFATRYEGEGADSSSVFSVIYGLVTFIGTLAVSGFRFSPSPSTVWLGIACGVSLFLYNLCAIMASRSGPYAFQSLMQASGAMLVQLFFAVILWGESLKALQWAGIAMMLLAFVIFNLKGLRFDGAKKGYFLWVMLLFFANGAYGTLMDSQQRLMAQTERNEMIMITFLTCTVISLIYLLIRKKSALPKAFFRMGRKSSLFALLSSVCAAAAIHGLMLTLKLVPASLLYPCINGGLLVLSALACKFLFKEKISWYMAAGMGLAAAALVILNL